MDKATLRRMIVLVIGMSVFSSLFVLSYGYAMHAPAPHRVRVDVVASAPTSAQVRVQLERTAPGGFDLRQRPTEQDARADLLGGSVYGALVVPATGTADVLTAGAQGVPVQQLVSTSLTGAAAALHRPVHQTDVAPLSPGDRNGQAAFVYEFGLLVPGVIGSVLFYIIGRRSRLWFRAAAAGGYAVVASVLGALVLDAGLGALTGSPWTLMATGAFVAAVFLLTLAALHAVFGLPGTGIGAISLLMVGNAANGSTVPLPFLPDGYRQIAAWLPNSAAVRAFRDDIYFSANGTGQPLLALALWAGGALTVIALVDLHHLRLRRRTAVEHAHIHATPVLSRLRTGTHRAAKERQAGPSLPS